MFLYMLRYFNYINVAFNSIWIWKRKLLGLKDILFVSQIITFFHRFFNLFLQWVPIFGLVTQTIHLDFFFPNVCIFSINFKNSKHQKQIKKMSIETKIDKLESTGRKFCEYGVCFFIMYWNVRKITCKNKLYIKTRIYYEKIVFHNIILGFF